MLGRKETDKGCREDRLGASREREREREREIERERERI